VAAEECGCAGAQSKRSADPLGQTLESQDGPKACARSIAQLMRLGWEGEGALTSQPDPLDLVLFEPLFGAVIELGGAWALMRCQSRWRRNVWQPIGAVIPAAAARRRIIRQASSWLTGLLESALTLWPRAVRGSRRQARGRRHGKAHQTRG
jgi:hypothetical protein